MDIQRCQQSQTGRSLDLDGHAYSCGHELIVGLSVEFGMIADVIAVNHVFTRKALSAGLSLRQIEEISLLQSLLDTPVA